jgi:hypothetical protein
MFSKIALMLAVTAAAGTTAMIGASNAEARGGGKEHFVQDYHFKKPMHGYSGRAGDYYCDYIRLPERRCMVTASGQERCKVVGWTLRQTCY